MSDPFDDGPKKHDGPTRVGLAAPRPLTSAELEAKYRDMKHDGIELAWPVMFLDEQGKPEPLTDHDRAALAHLGVTEEEYLMIELGES
jgi:hypothetical protein